MAKKTPSAIRTFLEDLFKEKLATLYILLWTLPDKQSRWFDDVGSAVGYAESLHKHNLYVGVGLAAQDYGADRRCHAEEIAGMVGVWVDVDLKSDAHCNAALPGTINEALSILPQELPPTFVVLTGNGLHAWWLFREHWLFHSDEERREAAALAKRWNTMIRDEGRIKGWNIDRLQDLARLLRVPGTTNCKDVGHPKPVTIHSHTDHRYNPSDLVEFLDDMGVADDDTEGQHWNQRFQDQPLAIDLLVTIPESQITKWMELDARFKDTWFRQRSDLHDQSQSGYDFALANFGFSQGLTAQQIVDVLIHHRRMHKQKSRTRLDYFYRTLSKAEKNDQKTFTSCPASGPLPFAETRGGDIGTALQNPGCGEQPKSDRAKIDLCKKLSGAFGVELLRIVKLSGDEPFFRMDLAEGSITFSSTGKFLSQREVRMGIAGRVSRLIPSFKPAHWQLLAQTMLDACIIEDGGEELESTGTARLQIAQYLADVAFIPCIEGRSHQDLRRPLVREGQIAVCANDLQIYINKTRPQSISTQAASAMLSVVGAKVDRVRGKKFKEQSRWMLPLEHFDPADYASPASGERVDHG